MSDGRSFCSLDIFTLLATERRRLADELALLSDTDWQAASLCEGWTNHTVAAHLNLAWSVGKLDLLAGLVRARGDIAKTVDRASRQVADRMRPADCIAALRDHATDRFTPPTLPAEAPLTDAVLHGADILRPLGRAVPVAPDAMIAVLQFLTDPKATRGFRSLSLDGLAFQATDLDWNWTSDPSPGPPGTITGPALAVAGVLVGRPAYLSDLTGDGVALVAARL